MKDIRPYICAKLKEMKETGRPVWFSFNNKRYMIAPFDPWGEDWPQWDQGWFLTKRKGRYYISWVHERQGRAHVSRGPGEIPSYESLDSVLAIVLEIHPYHDVTHAPNDPEIAEIYQRQAAFFWGVGKAVK